MFQSLCALAEDTAPVLPHFLCILWETLHSCWNLNEALHFPREGNPIHPTQEVTHECPRKVFTNNGYISLMLLLIYAPGSIQNMLRTLTP